MHTSQKLRLSQSHLGKMCFLWERCNRLVAGSFEIRVNSPVEEKVVEIPLKKQGFILMLGGDRRISSIGNVWAGDLFLGSLVK